MSATHPLDDKVALVTGAASGIGRAIAEAFSRRGARVLVHDIRETGLEVAEEIGGAFLQADLSDMAQTRGLARRALEAEGRVDILVNNAGFQHMSAVEDFPEETWAQLVQVLLVAPFQLTKHLIPGMKQRKWGRIINMSSIHGLVASPYKSAYVSAKHGLVGFTKTVALEAGTDGVTVNAICPTFTRTPLVEAQIGEQARILGISEDDVVEQVMVASAAIKRLVEPEEVAALACFLASEDARSITGAALTIDAGWTAR
ncbi:MAG: 3-hydroxybutyrate dehydrogenase [Chloroflexi bacterium]|nr:3-hydroxybutyrate dehydrogenase [Chloroflexota bacterium]